MAISSLMQRSLDLPLRSHGSAMSSPSRQRRGSGEFRHVPEITLLLEQKRTRPGVPPYLESVQVPISSTVKDVRLKLQNLKGWHADKAKCALVNFPSTDSLSMHACCSLQFMPLQFVVPAAILFEFSLSPHMQVLGDRDLMEHEVVGQLAKRGSASSDYLHVFVKLCDVSSVSLDSDTSRPLTFDLSDAPSTALSPRSALTHSLVTSRPVQPLPSEDRSAAMPFASTQFLLLHLSKLTVTL